MNPQQPADSSRSSQASPADSPTDLAAAKAPEPEQAPASDQSTAGDTDKEDVARKAGRGGLAVLTAKVFFIFSGLVQQTLLPRLIGLAGYGALSRVFAVANIANNVVVTASIQGASRSMAQTPPEYQGQTLRRVIKTHTAIAIPIALLFFFFAPVYARFQVAQRIETPLRVVSLVVLFYGLYAPLVGTLNGQRRFSAQAALDITYAVLRTAGLLGLGYILHRWNMGVLGATIGFALAATLIFPIALRVTGTGEPGDHGPSVREHLTFIAPVALGQVFLQLLMQADITILGRFASLLSLGATTSAQAAADASDKIVGVYRACQLFAFLPFQLLITLTFIMFPMLAKAHAEKDHEAVAKYVQTGMRLAFVFASIMVATVSALAPHLLRMLYPAEVSEHGGDALRILALGQGTFSIFYIETTVLTSLGKERTSAKLTGLAALLIGVLSWIAGSTATDSNSLLVRTALATSVALLISAIVGAVFVRRTAGAYLRVMTGVRVIAALGIVAAAGLFVPYWGKLLVVIQAGAMALLVIFLLVVTGEVGKQDLDTLLHVVKRNKAGT